MMELSKAMVPDLKKHSSVMVFDTKHFPGLNGI